MLRTARLPRLAVVLTALILLVPVIATTSPATPRPAGPRPEHHPTGPIGAHGAPAEEPFTLEQVLSSPFPSGLVAAPEGGTVAWVQNDRGVRNVWAADPPYENARRITGYAADDGQPLGDLAFTPDGDRIVYVRGGAPNRQREHPNPRSVPAGAERALWVVGVEGDEPRKLAEGHSPAVHPDGAGVAFLRQGGAWWTDLEEGAEAERLFVARGSAGSLRWSPDGSRLAFVSDRSDHGYVGVYDRGAATITWMDPGVDRDVGPAWSPDGSRLAFLRIPADSELRIFQPRREATAWSIRVADAATGEGTEVWRAEPGPGSAFRGLESEDQLFWGDGDRIVFPWERNGWLELYAVEVPDGDAGSDAAPSSSPEPRRAVPLTPGRFMVEHVALTPDRSRIVYSSNQDHVDRRRIWSVPVAGGEPEPITEGGFIEWSPTPTGEGDAVAFFRSSARLPAHAAVDTGSGQVRDLVEGWLPGDFPVDELVEPEQVNFPAADGMEIHGQLFVPADAAPGDGRPGVLFFHGGSRRQMLLGWHYRGYYHNAYALNQFLASRGFLVLSVNYRSGIGYGMEFREALNYGAAGASEFNDVLGAGLYLASQPEVDPARIGLWGGSYGGYLTALGLARASDLFAAGVDLHGVHDWNEVIRNFVPSYDPVERREAARLAFESSPLADVETWRSPVLLIHGDDDRNVPFSETVDLVEALREQGVDYELMVFPDEVHGFLTHARWLQAYRAAADFFARKLAEPGDSGRSRKSRPDHDG